MSVRNEQMQRIVTVNSVQIGRGFSHLGPTYKAPNGCARATMVPQHSHMSEVYAINAVGTRLTDEILDFVKTGK